MKTKYRLDQIKDCPFCGGKSEPQLIQMVEGKKGTFLERIECSSCNSCSIADEDRNVCIKAWNKRIDKKEQIENKTSIVRLPELKNIVFLSSSTIDRMEHEGKFPKRIKLGKNAVAWKRQEIDEWIEKCSRGINSNNK
jgi:prophage regulatory protein